MRNTLFLFSAVLLACVITCADELNVGGLPYKDVRIIRFDGLDVTFVLGGRRIKKHIDGIKEIHLAGKEDFNRAEEHLSHGRPGEAIEIYSGLLKKGPKGWRKRLIEHRLAFARKARTASTRPAGAAAKAPGPTTAPVAAKRCSRCRGTGTLWCTACRFGGRYTGKTRCRDCNATGRISCPVCEGEWRKDPCYECKGAGKMERTRRKWVVTKRVRSTKWYRDRNEGKYVTKRFREKCSDCGGKGYDWICPKCSKEARTRKGTIPCPTCKGTSFAGHCLTCGGTKKVPCSICETPGSGNVNAAGNIPRANKGVQESSFTPAAIISSIRKHDRHPRENTSKWSKMTMLQREEAERAYGKALAGSAAVSDFHGRSVTWVLKLIDVRSADDGVGYDVRTRAEENILVRAQLGVEARSSLLKITKGDLVRVSGTVREYGRVEKFRGLWDTRAKYCIELNNASIAFVTSGPPSRSSARGRSARGRR